MRPDPDCDYAFVAEKVTLEDEQDTATDCDFALVAEKVTLEDEVTFGSDEQDTATNYANDLIQDQLNYVQIAHADLEQFDNNDDEDGNEMSENINHDYSSCDSGDDFQTEDLVQSVSEADTVIINHNDSYYGIDDIFTDQCMSDDECNVHEEAMDYMTNNDDEVEQFFEHISDTAHLMQIISLYATANEDFV